MSRTDEKVYKSLSAYLKAQGVNSTTSESEIRAHKKAWKKLYHQNYYQSRKKREYRMTIRLKPAVYRYFQQAKKSHRRKRLNGFLPECARAYLEQGYIGHNVKEVELLNKQIRKIGNTINQVVHSIHRSRRHRSMSGSFAGADILQELERKYTELVGRVGEAEQKIEQFFDSPATDVKSVLNEYVRSHPEAALELRTELDKIISQNQ